ncbi:hypothetical protein GPECTOR_16g667 [Gonium pectorale]|uniref:Uncharacterized protein n=1 Tax=Gonium pectorale TaxID=33097 RepID=A0A150GL08_GONPE|nr:hypothetical protein GPECTOR_16g667 [Gonium pectorale]|eukprot:KXZ50492.1 hypothetical protein GPECTOR_16g667 [Gonium pectorale]
MAESLATLLVHLPALHVASAVGATREALEALERLVSAAALVTATRLRVEDAPVETALVDGMPPDGTHGLALKDSAYQKRRLIAAALQIADNSGVTPLLYAAQHRQAELLAALLAAGAHPEWPTLVPSGNSALHVAALKGDLASARHLMAALSVAAVAATAPAGAVRPQDGTCGSHGEPTAHSGRSGGDADGDAAAAERADAGSAAGGCPVDILSSNGSTPLLYAAGVGHLGVAALLIKAGADPARGNADGVTPLMAAASGGHPNVLTLLLRALQERASVPLEAGAGGAVGAVLAAIGAADANGSTALHYAARRGSSACVSRLLDAAAAAAAATPAAAAQESPLAAAADVVEGAPTSVLPSLPDLELAPRHLAGLGLAELSAAQLEGLEALHRAALARIAEARLALAVGVEVARAEEERLLALEIRAVREGAAGAE